MANARKREPSHAAADSARRLLRGAGLAATRVRVACLAFALEAGGPVSREEFGRAVRGGRLDRVTLYRTLRTFEEAGLLRRERTASGPGGGDLWCVGTCEHGHAECPGHVHFECRECGRVECVRTSPSRVSEALGAIFAGTGLPDADYSITGARVEASGVCRECRGRD